MHAMTSMAALLHDPDYLMPSVPSAFTGMAWLRANVARFCDGSDHVRRRALTVAQLAQLDPSTLRSAHGEPAEILAAAMGLPSAAATDVATAAAVYHPHNTAGVDADLAVERLVAACGGRHDETTAARIGLLVQAHAATAALIAGTNPPVSATRRTTLSGDTHVIDLTGLAFGAGPHSCPGRAHALALASTQLRFHRLHSQESPLIVPNAWDCASAAAFAQAGFDAVGTTSLGVAAAHGLPDAAAATIRQTLELASRLVLLPVPVTIDIEAGFGVDPADLAAQLWELGVSGVNLEDGRGDHLENPAKQAAWLRRFKDAAPAMFLNARVDTHWLSQDLPSSLPRIQRYEDAGADGIFVPGLTDNYDISEIVNATKLPVNVLAQPNLQRLRDLGVRRVSTGSEPYRAALAAALASVESVRDTTAAPTALDYRTVDRLAQLCQPLRPSR